MIEKLTMGMAHGIYDNSRAITELVKAGWTAAIEGGGGVTFDMTPPGSEIPFTGNGQTLNVAIRRCLEKVKESAHG